jgi:hypothetical protein
MIRATQFCIAMATLSALVGAAPAPSVSIVVSAPRPSILAGEPLFLTLTLKNMSTEKLLLRSDPDSFARVSVAPNGERTVWTAPPPEGDTGTFFKEVAPGEQETIKMVATETSRLTLPGQYRMTVEYVPLRASGVVDFNVQSFDEGALRARADAIHEAAVTLHDAEGGLNETALSTIEPEVARPFLCDVLKRKPDAVTTARKLEELADSDSIGCLIQVLPNSQGLQREVIIGALRTTMGRVQDDDLREKIGRALSGQR